MTYSSLLATFFVMGVAADRQCSIQPDMDSHGGDYSSQPAGSAEDCCAACSADSRCKTAVLFDNVCYLKSSSNLFQNNGSEAVIPASPADPCAWIKDIAAGAGGRYQLEPKVYYIDKQYQLPANTELHGAGAGGTGTIIKAFGASYDGICASNAKNRKGFVLGDNTYIGKLHFVGMESKRFSDNQLLCGGAPFETPGCAGTGKFTEAPDECDGDIGLGHGIQNATVEDVTVEAMTVQNVFYMPPTKAGARVSKDIIISKLVCNGTWADGMNIHGAHQNVLVRDCELRNTGDDNYAVWSVGLPGADNITFLSNVGVDPWYRRGGSSVTKGYPNSDNCFAVYGGKSSTFLDNVCTGGHDAIVIFGNDLHKTYGGQFSEASSTRVQGNRGTDKEYPPCYFGVDFPGNKICEAGSGAIALLV